MPRRKKFTEEQLRKALVGARSVPEVAGKLGVTTATVYTRLREYKVPIPKTVTTEEASDLLNHYKGLVKIGDLAEEFTLSPNTVRNRLWQAFYALWQQEEMSINLNLTIPRNLVEVKVAMEIYRHPEMRRKPQMLVDILEVPLLTIEVYLKRKIKGGAKRKTVRSRKKD